MLIFVTVGNAKQPFDRLLRALDEALAGRSDVQGMVQHGTSSVRVGSPGSLEHRELLPRPDVDAWLARADVLVVHAGIGSLASAVQAGHRPIVMPRLHRHGEHVNDHQIELCDQLGARGLATVVQSARELRAALEPGTTRRGPPRDPSVVSSGVPIVGRSIASGASGYRGSWLVRALARLGPPTAAMRIPTDGSRAPRGGET